MPIKDKSLYPSNWKTISKFIRFYRANNRCENCGAINYMPHPLTGSKVILTVAHLDHNPKNNSFFNLKALCQRCHNNHDKYFRINNRKSKKLKGQLKLWEFPTK